MDIVPHVGEIGLIIVVVLLILGLGRLPQLSYKLAGGEPPPRDADTGSELPSESEDEASGEENSPEDETEAEEES